MNCNLRAEKIKNTALLWLADLLTASLIIWKAYRITLVVRAIPLMLMIWLLCRFVRPLPTRLKAKNAGALMQKHLYRIISTNKLAIRGSN